MKNCTQYKSNSITLEHPVSQNNPLTVQVPSDRMLVVIDPKVEDAQMLAAGVYKGAEVLLLDPNRDGVEQITQVLRGRTDISSVHLVSHGSPGCLELGSTQLSLDTLDCYVSQLQIWLSSIPSASLLLYGCSVASGETGITFLQRLHQLTSANIAASPERVGNAAKGGSWELKCNIGQVTSGLAFLPEVRQAYSGVFDPIVRITATPTTLVESEQTLLTFTFSLSEPPPPGGVTVSVSSNVPQSLTQLNVFAVNVTGGNFPQPDINFTGLNFTITQQTATISVPIFPDAVPEAPQQVTYFLQPGAGYSIDPAAGSTIVTFVDTPLASFLTLVIGMTLSLRLFRDRITLR